MTGSFCPACRAFILFSKCVYKMCSTFCPRRILRRGWSFPSGAGGRASPGDQQMVLANAGQSPQCVQEVVAGGFAAVCSVRRQGIPGAAQRVSGDTRDPKLQMAHYSRPLKPPQTAHLCTSIPPGPSRNYSAQLSRKISHSKIQKFKNMNIYISKTIPNF